MIPTSPTHGALKAWDSRVVPPPQGKIYLHLLTHSISLTFFFFTVPTVRTYGAKPAAPPSSSETKRKQKSRCRSGPSSPQTDPRPDLRCRPLPPQSQSRCRKPRPSPRKPAPSQCRVRYTPRWRSISFPLGRTDSGGRMATRRPSRELAASRLSRDARLSSG